MNRILTIAKNTFTETIRQPVYAVIIISALLLIILGPSISMYTLEEDDKLLRELALSTLFLSGLFIAVFSATSAVSEEIETGTITTVLSKPVPRPIFIIGKFFGISTAVILAHYLISAAMLMAMRHGVMETATDEFDFPVIVMGSSIIILSLLISGILNYTYEWNFTASGIITFSILTTISLILLLFIDKHWKFGIVQDGFKIFDVYASILLLFAVLILVAIAVMLSTRMNIVLTLSICLAIFLLGLVSDYIFARFADQNPLAKIGMFLTPNFQIFWVSDAIYEEKPITLSYIWLGFSYAGLYIAGILAFAITLFQRRQVG